MKTYTTGLLDQRKLRRIWGYRALYLMVVVGFAYFVIFKYATIYGLLIVFKNYSPRLGILGSPWAGISNFQKVFGSNPDLPLIIRNKLVISFSRLIFGFPAPIILALLLNELKSPVFKRTIQSVLYLPNFLSWIIMAGILTNLFSITNGVIPLFFRNMEIEMPALMSDPSYFVPFLIFSDIWKGMGWGTIIYLAAISGIDAELYESAVIDGCNRFQQVLHITIPSISLTIVTLLVLSAGGIMNAGFDQIFNLYSARTWRVSEIIDTYVYSLGIQSGRFEFSTIIGLFKSAVNCALLLTVNWAAGRIGESSPL